MKDLFRRSLSLLLSLVMVLSIVSGVALAEGSDILPEAESGEWDPAISSEMENEPEQNPEQEQDPDPDPTPDVAPDVQDLYVPTGLSDSERQAILSRPMDSWYFPVAEEYFDDIVDIAGCRGSMESVLYGDINDYCISMKHGEVNHGSDALLIRVNANTEVYAPTSGTLYRSTMSDMERGYLAVIEQNLGTYSYYLILFNLSPDAPVVSGSYVNGGDRIGYSGSGDLGFAAVMDVSGRGQKIAEDAYWELFLIEEKGWLTGSEGTGILCVNPSAYTVTSYSNNLTRTYTGPIAYRFVQIVTADPVPSDPIPVDPIPTDPISTDPVIVETPTEHTHNWDLRVTSQEPTHVSEGQMQVICTGCGESYMEPIAKTSEHAFDQEIPAGEYLAEAANCSHPAYYNYSCICGQRGTETFAYGEALGHTYSNVWNYNDNFHWHDATCGHSDETSEMGEHSWDAGQVTVQPTHMSSGQAVYTCTVCGCQKNEVLDATAEHTFDQKLAEEAFLKSGATCDTPAEYYLSCICGQRGTETFVSGAALGHTYSDSWSTNDTHHWHSATCGHTDTTTGFAEHSWDGGKETVKAGHNVNGETVYTCTVCGYQKTEVVPGEPHLYDQTVVADQYLKQAATCTEPAVYYKSCTCSEAGTETFAYGAAKGHTFAETWSHNELQHWHDAACGHNEKSRIADHIWDFGKITTAPTETTKGVKTYTCAVCGRTRTEEVAASAHQHTFGAGWSMNETFHWHASTCGHTGEVGDLGQHIWDGGKITVQPSHSAAGEKTYTCLTCGAIKRETIPAEHKFTQQVPAANYLKSYATCTSPAVYYYSCSCGAKGTESFYFGNSLGHTMSSSWTWDQNYHWSTCVVCGTRAQMTPHSFTSYTNTCSVCGYTKNGGSTANPAVPSQNPDASHNHISHLTRVPGRVATCTMAGNRDYYTCSCGMWFSDVTAKNVITDHDSVVIPATGHLDQNKDGKCDACKAAVAVQTVTYQITEGANTTWISSSEQGLVFRANSDYSKFDHVEVDGKTISSLNYDVSSGSTIVELSPGYLKTLEVRKHSISIVSKDGKATTEFTIKKGTSAAPVEKNNGNSLWVVILVFLILLILAAAAAVAYLVYFKKPKGGKYSR